MYVGWLVMFLCVFCVVVQVFGNLDCSNYIQICSNILFSVSFSGLGIVLEGCLGCVIGEIYFNWYIFVVQISGMFIMIIMFNFGSDDFDFVIYGLGFICFVFGMFVWCFYVVSFGVMGFSMLVFDNFEDVNGDGIVVLMNIVVG